MWNRVPLVVILGPTGVGKTKLSLELAKRFSGEIISADSMQVYKGLDVITNKATDEEQKIAPHHLLDFLDPLKTFSVVHFRNKALPIIRNLQAKRKVPIVVGGTHYYIESLLWDILVEEEDCSLADNKFDAVTATADLNELQAWVNYAISLQKEKFDSIPEEARLKAEALVNELINGTSQIIIDSGQLLDSPREVDCSEVDKLCRQLDVHVGLARSQVRELLLSVRSELGLRVDPEIRRVQNDINKRLHERLMNIDPQTASTLHPNSRRKILRALQIHASKGVPQSELIVAQRSQKGGNANGGPLRFKDAIMFWIRCQEDVLDKRLDDRVDDMVARGLVQELLDFHKTYNEKRLQNVDTSTAYTQGIFQSIGFKEFHSYLTLEPADRNSDAGRELLNEGIKALKAVTRRYARKQIKWIRNRFIRAKDREVPEIYGLDATDLNTWDDKVLKPAADILGTRLGLPGYASDQVPLPKEDPLGSLIQANHCPVCDRIFMDTLQWSAHLKSNKHKRMEKKRKTEPQDKFEKKLKSEPILV